MDAAPQVTLQEAAARLGVHYQTVYRWVRRGVLPAVKVAGAYLIDGDALEAFVAARSVPEAPPERLQVRDWSTQARRLQRALVAGDEGATREVIDRLHEGGIPLAEICDLVLRPALVGIGEAWMAGELGVAEEHRASAMLERQLGRLTPMPPGRPRGVCVVCSPPREEHHLPGAMATAVLREDHWQVHHLGIGLPVDQVRHLADSEAADLVVISVTWPPARADAEQMSRDLAATGRRVLIGRPGDTLADLLRDARGQRDPGR